MLTYEEYFGGPRSEEEKYAEWSYYYEWCIGLFAKPLNYSEWCDRWGWRVK